MNAPDGASPLTGYRVWGVVHQSEGRRLQSMASGFFSEMPIWEPYEPFRASCLARRDCGAAPNVAHGCGVHSFCELTDALMWAAQMSKIRPVVVGSVKIWGQVVEAARGWRAQYAYPSAIHLGRGFRHADLKALAATYGVAFAA